MPNIVSFAWTTPALLAGRKTVTRRDWSPQYAARFRRGDEVIAYDRQPRSGGRPVARLRLVEDVRREADADAPDGDYEAEGFGWFWDRELARAFAGGWDTPHSEIARRTCPAAFDAWRRAGGSSYVVRFQVVEYLAGERAPRRGIGSAGEGGTDG